MHVMDLWTSPDAGGKRAKNQRYGRGKRWLARWTEPGTRRERSRAFDRREFAEQFLAQMRTGRADGSWVDPSAGRKPLGHYLKRWLATKDGKAETTRVWYAALVEGRVGERWSDVPAGKVTRAAVIEWLAQIHSTGGEGGAPLSASRVRAHYVVLNGALDLAVADQAIATNPARDVQLPKLPEKQPKALTVKQLAAYVAALESPTPSSKKHARRRKPAESCERAACFALVLTFSGLRFGECARLDVHHLLGRRLLVEESISTIGGRQVEADTKSHRQRYVSIPAAVADRVRAMVGDRTDGPLLPAPRGGRWHHGVWTRTHAKACRDAGLGHITVHALRSTAASLAIAHGADAKVVQRMLGHASATLTLDTYSAFFDDRLDEVSDAMEAAVPQRPQLRVV